MTLMRKKTANSLILEFVVALIIVVLPISATAFPRLGEWRSAVFDVEEKLIGIQNSLDELDNELSGVVEKLNNAEIQIRRINLCVPGSESPNCGFERTRT